MTRVGAGRRAAPTWGAGPPSNDEFRVLLATGRPAIYEFFANLGRRGISVTRMPVSATALDAHSEDVETAAAAAVDVGSDPAGAIELCDALRRRRPELPLSALICCAHSTTPWMLRALLRMGVASILDLQTPGDEALRALHSIARGGAILHLPSWGHRRGLEEVLAGGADVRNRMQFALLELVAHGLPDHEIARRLHLSPHTVKHQIEGLRDVVGARNRIELAAWAGRNGFYSRDPRTLSEASGAAGR